MVIPVYNEEKHVEGAVKETVSGLESRRSSFELIVVENGSTDSSPQILDRLARTIAGVKVIHLPKPSYGNALKVGLLESKGDLIGHFSVDIVDFDFLDRALIEIEHADVVLGSKLISGNSDARPLMRRFGSASFHNTARLILGIEVRDTHGIKLMRRQRVQSIINSCVVGDEVFDDEFILRASRKGLSLKEIPFRTEEVRPSRQSVMGRALRAMRQILRLKLQLWRESLGR